MFQVLCRSFIAFVLMFSSLAGAAGVGSRPNLSLASSSSANSSLLERNYNELSGAEQSELRQLIRSQPSTGQRHRSGYQKSQGGWTGGGGGNGIACFDERVPLESIFDKNQSLKAEAIPLIRSIQSYDLINGRSMLQLLVPQDGETWSTYLDRVIKNRIEPLLPLFAVKLKKSLALLRHEGGELRQWHSQVKLPKVNDIEYPNPMTGDSYKEGNLQCHRLQLAVRYAQKIAGSEPAVFVDYNADLFELLRVSNQHYGVAHQAALVLHEAVYLMRVELGAEFSDELPYLVSYLLSELLNFRGQKLYSPENETRVLDSLIRIFGLAEYEQLFTGK